MRHGAFFTWLRIYVISIKKANKTGKKKAIVFVCAAAPAPRHTHAMRPLVVTGGRIV